VLFHASLQAAGVVVHVGACPSSLVVLHETNLKKAVPDFEAVVTVLVVKSRMVRWPLWNNTHCSSRRSHNTQMPSKPSR